MEKRSGHACETIEGCVGGETGQRCIHVHGGITQIPIYRDMCAAAESACTDVPGETYITVTCRSYTVKTEVSTGHQVVSVLGQNGVQRTPLFLQCSCVSAIPYVFTI